MENRPDERDAIYRDLHSRQLEPDEANNRHAAQVILGMLFEIFRPESVLDVGCGLGTWLAVAREMGVRDIQGVDGSWLEKSRLRVPEQSVQVLDLEKPFDLGRRFDLVICLEVAEHLDERAARGIVASLVKHGDVVLFSAAIPHQGGHHHVNEQWPDYWDALFAERRFETLDFLRARIWKDSSILWWLRQNLLLMVRKSLLEGSGVFSTLKRKESPLSLVHPDFYLGKLKQLTAIVEEHQKILGLLSAGGTFNVRKEAGGNITITRI